MFSVLDNITFSVDGEEPITVLSSKASSSSHAARLPFTTLSTQTSVSKVTPFHKNVSEEFIFFNLTYLKWCACARACVCDRWG